jgi:pseudouridine synthase
VCSRKEGARLIEASRVRVSGRVVRTASFRIDPAKDRVTVDGRRVGDETERLVLALNKPRGYVTTRTDPGGRPTVYALLGDVGRWVFPVGRLDRDSAGLLLFTNDHRLGHRLTDPAHATPKRYHVLVEGLPSSEVLGLLRSGLDIGDETFTRPAGVVVLGASRHGRTWLEVTLIEGRNRQVRRMCAVVGHDVVELVRVGVAGLDLGDLAVGEWRRLGPPEVARLSSGGGPARERPLQKST